MIDDQAFVNSVGDVVCLPVLGGNCLIGVHATCEFFLEIFDVHSRFAKLLPLGCKQSGGMMRLVIQ